MALFNNSRVLQLSSPEKDIEPQFITIKQKNSITHSHQISSPACDSSISTSRTVIVVLVQVVHVQVATPLS